uniref:Uncharacterized protein n=1 Tax=Ananas comosus var. bracteatus TaxID=296719 RepID=A0A6V7NNK2_ANACO|nr:unnamed protein product [Ananas comosus var. bracteatus]
MAIGSRGGIAALLEICGAGTPSAQAAAAGVLLNLSAIPELHQNFLEENGVPYSLEFSPLGRLSRKRTPGLDQNLESAIGLLRNLASFRYIAEIVSSAGFIPYIVSSLDSAKSSNVGIQGGGEEKEAALKALGSLIAFTAYRRLFKKDEKGIVNVVQLLDPLVTNVEKKHAVSVLLASSDGGGGGKEASRDFGEGKILGVFPRA